MELGNFEKPHLQHPNHFKSIPVDLPYYFKFAVDHGTRSLVGGIWIFLWTIIILTNIRFLRQYFKIKWTKSDELQMKNDFDNSLIIKMFIFEILLVIITYVWTVTEFTKDCLYYGIAEGSIIIICYVIKLIYDRLIYAIQEIKDKRRVKTKND